MLYCVVLPSNRVANGVDLVETINQLALRAVMGGRVVVVVEGRG